MADEDTPDPATAAEDHLNEQRRQLAILCKSAKTRTSAFTRDAPCDWNPEAVTDPQTGDFFTEPSAWERIAEALEAGCRIETIDLRKPPGSKGYVIRLAGEPERDIYVKLQFGQRKVIGRSFHYTYF